MGDTMLSSWDYLLTGVGVFGLTWYSVYYFSSKFSLSFVQKVLVAAAACVAVILVSVTGFLKAALSLFLAVIILRHYFIPYYGAKRQDKSEMESENNPTE